MRDTILVVGPSACGKTHVLNMLRSVMGEQYHVPHEFIPHSDAHTVLSRVQEDDTLGAQNHYHPWEGGGLGHRHDVHSEITPFTLAGFDIGRSFMQDFFVGLAQLPYDGRLRYAEWSGGRNINPPDELASRVDLSFQTMAAQLRDGTLYSGGLARVLTVLHIDTDRESRLALNGGRINPSASEIELGLASWPLNETAMRIFGDDDFLTSDMPSVLLSHGIPHIWNIHNDLQGGLERELGIVLPEIVGAWQSVEGGRGGGMERR